MPDALVDLSLEFRRAEFRVSGLLDAREVPLIYRGCTLSIDSATSVRVHTVIFNTVDQLRRQVSNNFLIAPNNSRFLTVA